VKEIMERKIYDVVVEMKIKVISKFCVVFKYIKIINSRKKFEIHPLIPRIAKAPGSWTLNLILFSPSGYLAYLNVCRTQSTTGTI
jgi:hypothetical protein